MRGSGAEVSPSDRQLLRMRDTLAHRGPDGDGVWTSPGVFLGQRRLEVVAPGEAGRQPMASRDGRWVIVYNGELYNDNQLREAMGRDPSSYRT
ncbi:MAG: asparagine synthetase B, partial [Phycisphaerales bacterium JB060]